MRVSLDYIRRCFIRFDGASDKIWRWICRTLLRKVRAFLTGVGVANCLLLIGWRVASGDEYFPWIAAASFSLGFGLVGLVVHTYYRRFKILGRVANWLNRKATERKDRQAYGAGKSAQEKTPVDA